MLDEQKVKQIWETKIKETFEEYRGIKRAKEIRDLVMKASVAEQ